MDGKGSVRCGDGISIFGETSFFPIRPVSPAELVEILTLKGLDVSASVDLLGAVTMRAKTEDGGIINVMDVQRVFSWTPVFEKDIRFYSWKESDVLVLGKANE